MDVEAGSPRFDPANPGFELRLDLESSGLVANVTGRIDGIEALIAMFMRIAAELRRTADRADEKAAHTPSPVCLNTHPP